jgi:hypothetical protein
MSQDSLLIISLDSKSESSPQIELNNKNSYLTQSEWISRQAYNFVVSRLGKFIPWDPAGWPDEVADQGCRCSTYSYTELRDENNEGTDVWACSGCLKPKPLMFYVEWCESCGTPYVVKRYPDRTLLCGDCGG